MGIYTKEISLILKGMAKELIVVLMGHYANVGNGAMIGL